ncbi:thiol reductant ABC exporter subunit CydD [Amycolatopsis sp. DSM 110486]|uniref:thiol reductant ABC exporter subunit CydD n=1 Tax=Amycolatopsis sp. DSM 110486 TaxID=2865832 RepID=UPI001C69EF23|nr:thiol reductant ABC exporter subunit CydD [Amycolatopsis sp. DSM 110486]QYN25187.1 thiol reductant ABC exporter subunit CydD [Amycolatopsis sp. DSM 110486]
MPSLPGSRRYLVLLGVLGALTAGVILLQAEGLATLLTGGGLGVTLLVAVGARVLLTLGQSVVTGRFAADAQAGLRRRLLGSTADAGVVTTQVTKGVDATTAYLTGYLPALVASVLVPVAVVVRLVTTDLTSALIVVATLPLIPVFAALVGARAKARTERQWALLTRLGGHFLDAVRGLPTLKLFGRARAQAQHVRAMADAHADATLGTLRVAFLSSLVLELVATLSIALIAVPIGFRLLEGSLTAHTAMLVLVLAPEAYLPLRAAGAKFHAAAEGLTAMREALATPLPARRGGTVTRPAGPPEIEFDGVSVRYGEVTALSEVDLVIGRGDHVAIAGPSGSGKSTLLAVLLGFVTPTTGRVLVDGVDLRSLDHAAWLRDTAWLPQRPTLFSGTVAENIALGSGADVPAAARAAALDEVVAELPEGYATRIGELGAGLSAGQRQRVGLARALARTDTGLVLLDEPTARLDRRTEQAVLDGAAALLPGRTALFVAHHPALAAMATRSVPLVGGRVPLGVR